MGKRGPAKTPTSLTLLHGNPGRRPINKNEPKPEPLKSVQCPRHLKGEAKKIWQRNARRLRSLGLLTENDIDEFSKYCHWRAEYLRLLELVDKSSTLVLRADELCKGQSYIDIDKQDRYITAIIQNPLVRQLHKASEYSSRIAARFGFTPSDRTGIEIKDDSKEIKGDSFEQFVKSRKG